MLVWKGSSAWFAAGLAATAGLVWFGHTLSRRRLRDGATSNELDASDEAPRPLVALGSGVNAAEAARRDALRDLWSSDIRELGGAGEDAVIIEEELGGEAGRQASLDEEPDEANDLDEDEADIEMVPFSEESQERGEHYDAVDAEDLGTEWLLRATQSELDRPEESLFTTETFGAFASEAADETASELPVGTTDPQGNVELRTSAPRRPTQVDLSPNDEELARRAAVSERDHGTNGRRQ